MPRQKDLLGNIRDIARDFAADRLARQARCELDPADIETLRQAGLHLLAVPDTHGGWWRDAPTSLRLQCDALRLLAQGDPSVALVASMHPSMAQFWREVTPTSGLDAWEAQKREIFGGVLDGAWWGTLTSEPGSGGDIGRTRAKATPAGDGWRISGEKHFGSGSGAITHMITTAVRPGMAQPDWFFMDMRGVPWDGRSSLTLKAAWDGHGMRGTSSHAFTLTDFPATRVAWSGTWSELLEGSGTGGLYLLAPIVGVIDVAMRYMREKLVQRGPGPDAFSAFEQMEWTTAHREASLINISYDAAISAAERGERARQHGALVKLNVAILAELVMTRPCRISGGGAYSQRSPLGAWFEDVRAAGFLRPPWSIAQDRLFARSLDGEPGSMSIEA